MLKHLPVGFKGGAASFGRRDVAQAVGVKAQGALRGNARVQLAHRASGGVARVGEGLGCFFASGHARALAFVERLEVIAPHVHLAAHFQHGRGAAQQAQRDLADGADVLRDVFARGAVAARGRLHQHAVFVAQADGQAVELGLGHVGHGRQVVGQFQLAAHAGVKRGRAGGAGVSFGANAEHGHAVRHGRKAFQHCAAHALGGRIGRAQFGVGRLQRFKRAKQAVVLGVGNLRRIQRVVLPGGAVELLAQGGGLGSGRVGRLGHGTGEMD